MLRDYQIESIELIRESFVLGHKKVLLWLATGGGKTVVFCEMIRRAHEKGRKTLVVVRGRKLVDQASRRLTLEGIEHGVLMSGHWNYRPHLPHQVASIDTLISRRLIPEADLIIIDEAHLAGSKGYKEFLAQYNTFVVAVTATPYVDKGLKHIAETIVHPISMDELVEQGYLVPFRYFAPNTPDLSDVHVSSSTKDYVVAQLENAMTKIGLTGRIIEHWKQIAVDRATICFAVNIRHSKFLVEQFLDAGIEAEHCDADTPDDERNEIIQRLEKGITKVVCNVGILCTGVDIPRVSAIIMARPTCSRNLFIQQAGRGTRIFEGKSDCIILDHAGNIGRHDLPTDEEIPDLDGVQRSTGIRESKICKQCFAVYRGPSCTECGTVAPEAPAQIPEENDGQLVEIRPKKEVDPLKEALESLKREGRQKGRKTAWALYRFVTMVGEEMAEPYLPPWFKTHYNMATKSG